MEKTKITSVRLNSDTLDRLDGLTLEHAYWNRSYLINQVLAVILQCSDDDTLFAILSSRFAFEKGYVIKFEADADMMRQRAQQAKQEKF